MSTLGDSIQGRVARFSRTLSLALFDRSLELAGEQVHYFYDADVVLRMILGFELDSAERPKLLDGRSRLVRSLLSCHFLGPLRMLRPHAYELHDRLRMQSGYDSPTEQESFAQRTRQYLHEKGIEGVVAELRKVIAGVDAEKRVTDFLSVLRANASETFSTIESVNGPWAKRLRRFWDARLIEFDELGPEMSQLVKDKGDVVDLIRQIFIEEGSTRRPIPDFNDSVALAILNLLIETRDCDPSSPVVRFYTETPMLLNALGKSPRLRQLLTYNHPTNTEIAAPPEADFVARDADYLLMRASFPSLSPYSKDRDLSSLRWLSASLEQLLQMNSEEIAGAIQHIDWAGRSPLEAIKDFEDLNLMKSVWVAGNFHDAFNESLLAEWAEVFAFAHGKTTGERLFVEIDDIQRELEAKVSRIRAWSRDFEMLVHACKIASRRIHGPIEAPMRDLGLVRWGYSLSGEEEGNLTQTIKEILSGDESDLLTECAGLANRIERARKDVRECLIICAVLWALNRFNDIVFLIRDCEEVLSDLPASLILFKLAAQLKAAVVQDSSERTDLVEKAWGLTERLNEADRRGILLGVAYVLYHAWKQETMGLTLLNRRLPDNVQGWALKSFDASEAAVQALPTSNLAWAFAVNHCAYVGTVTGVRKERTELYLDQLVRLQAIPNFWNSRFDDTLGFDHLQRLELELQKPPGERSPELIERSLEKATQYFYRASKSDFGDIDLEEHIARLDRVRLALHRDK